ncbi:uncharacterized protein [Zea mays]|uniref:uncharacterized protein n=1 Tax=Zea mays TaxID=4577 RepID=UPI0004DE81C1|nr:uncharacterized protein LOC103643138 [Zea mays]|eukprot:XP_008664511.1 uncharacterized protein LOC103643138 [Zea mays]
MHGSKTLHMFSFELLNFLKLIRTFLAQLAEIRAVVAAAFLASPSATVVIDDKGSDDGSILQLSSIANFIVSHCSSGLDSDIQRRWCSGSGTTRRLRAATARCGAPTGSAINTMDTLQEAPSAPLEATAALYTIQFAVYFFFSEEDERISSTLFSTSRRMNILRNQKDPLSSTTQRSTRHHSVCPLLQRG